MKEIQNSLIFVSVALVALASLPRLALATNPQNLISISAGIAKDQILLAETPASGTKKQRLRVPKVNVDKKGVILKGYDAVAYFKESKAIKGSPRHTSSYRDAIYRFATAEDKAEFDKTPAKYAPQYGGFCANNMSKGKLSDIDPTQFMIFKGKLYVCASEPGLKTFSSNPGVNIPKADKNWQAYQPPENPGLRRELGS